MNKYAIFTMDVESFQDTSCLLNKNIVSNQSSMKDGLEIYLALLNRYQIKANLFVLSSFLKDTKKSLLKAIQQGHHISLHGLTHVAPLLQNDQEFQEQILKSKNLLEKELNVSISGYRAPCFSLDNSKLEILKDLGLTYDSSYLPSKHDFYSSNFTLKQFQKMNPLLYKKDAFFEFSLPIQHKFPIGGGGYVRIAPWFFIKSQLKQYLKNNDIYIFYLHPFEVSKEPILTIKNLKWHEKIYLKYNRKTFLHRIEKIIQLLKKEGFEFKTFEEILSSKEKEFLKTT